MFSFGLAALDQFKDRLVEWPQYCNHILLITHIRETHSELVEFIERALSRVARPQQPEIVQNVMMTSTAQQHLTPAVLQPLPPLSTSTPTESLEGATGPALPSDILSSQSQFVPGKVWNSPCCCHFVCCCSSALVYNNVMFCIVLAYWLTSCLFHLQDLLFAD
jgi:hypothetical protein